MTKQQIERGNDLLILIARWEKMLSFAEGANCISLSYVNPEFGSPQMRSEFYGMHYSVQQFDCPAAEVSNAALMCAKTLMIKEITDKLNSLRAELAALGTVNESAPPAWVVAYDGAEYRTLPALEFDASKSDDVVLFTGSEKECKAKLEGFITPALPFD